MLRFVFIIVFQPCSSLLKRRVFVVLSTAKVNAYDSEIHLNYGILQTFTSSATKSLNYDVELPAVKLPAGSLLCMRVTPGAVYVSGDVADVTLEHTGLFERLSPMYVGFNRPIDDALYDEIRDGVGTCAVAIDWAC